MKADAVILDVDGTIWNSTGIVADAWNDAAKEMKVKNNTITPEILKSYFGKTMEEIAAGLFEGIDEENRYKIMRLCEKKEQEYLEADPCHICYEGVRETVEAISKRIKVYVVSNCQKGYIELMLRKTGMEEFVTDFECYGNTGNGKAANIALLVRRNNIKKPVYVGDTAGDAEACKEAGVPFIFASYGFGSVDKYAAKINKFPDLLDIL
ncbi:MAG: HAD family hydrolase [Lachnospiraceae bacterium]|nr:HAD family hydrolase [Lachnospiraceae bacterium]